MRWNYNVASIYSHDDLSESRNYFFTVDDQSLVGKEIRSVCGYWFSACEDDPNYNPHLWRQSRQDARPTCPRCIERSPYAFPGMILIVRGDRSIPRIVQVTGDETWIVIVGIGSRSKREVPVERVQVLHVCQEGDLLEDLGLIVHNDELVPIDAEA